jgi:hypothetical protein
MPIALMIRRTDEASRAASRSSSSDWPINIVTAPFGFDLDLCDRLAGFLDRLDHGGHIRLPKSAW